MLKYLRIAVIALSLTACLLLIALWVRSYWWWDVVVMPVGSYQHIHVRLQEGRTWMRWRNDLKDEKWVFRSLAPDDMLPLRRHFTLFYYERTCYNGTTIGLTVAAPHWFHILMFAAVAAGAWTSWSRRFSLRILLIATTLVAAALGAISTS